MLKQTSAVLLASLFIGSAFAENIDLSKLPPASTQSGVTFEKNILPLFKESCVKCHGEERPKNGLRLTSLEGVLKGSKDGKVVVPGNSAKSDLVIAIARLDPETAMPPTREGHGRPKNGNAQNGKAHQGPPAKPLTPEQVGLVRAWIDQGAK
ncbi:MAG: c-type cytochrome domain-containing protein [Verrucomicrobiota bacterium]